jgi:hypothetical protein
VQIYSAVIAVPKLARNSPQVFLYSMDYDADGRKIRRIASHSLDLTSSGADTHFNKLNLSGLGFKPTLKFTSSSGLPNFRRIHFNTKYSERKDHRNRVDCTVDPFSLHGNGNVGASH